MEEGKSGVVAEVKRVMVAIDQSEASLYALDWALKNLGDSFANSEVFVFTAQPSSAFSYVSGFQDSEGLKSDVDEHHKKTASSLLEKAKDICRKFKVDNHSWHINSKKTASSLLEKAKDICRKFKITPKTVTEVGDPKDAICGAVDKYNIELLVVGNHGRGAVKRAFLGSVSNYCVHNVKCPVLVVRQHA